MGNRTKETSLMAAVLLRRSIAAAAAATVVTAIAPLASSFAVPSAFSASSITTKPAPDSNNVVPANRPQIIATFNDTVASGSVTLTVQGKTAELCGASTVSGKTVSCTPTADLDTTKTYEAQGQAKDSAGTTAKTAKLTFTVDYPV